jgi:transposase
VPDAEQQSWRDLTRTRYQLVVERGRVQSQVENLLERASIKLSSVITDLFGSSGRRILQALSEEAGAPWHSQNLARLAHPSLRASHEQLAEALDGHWSSEHRLLLQLHLERLSLLDRQIETLQQQMAESMKAHRGFAPTPPYNYWRKWDPQRPLFLAPVTWRVGLVCAPGSRRAQASRTASGPLRETGR